MIIAKNTWLYSEFTTAKPADAVKKISSLLDKTVVDFAHNSFLWRLQI